MDPNNTIKPVCLVILDGWGIAPAGPGNAIELASTPNMDKFWASFPHTLLLASGEAVGLPKGEAGNTETGHLNLGAGRIVYQDLPRINRSIADGSFYDNPSLKGAIEHAQKNNSNLHLMGLIGAGGVHSNLEHLFALITLAKKMNFNRVFIHMFTDGRDSPSTSAKTYVGEIRKVIAAEGVGTIASIMGRYWAMDRDLRWERTSRAYFALTKGECQTAKTPEEAIESSYTKGVTDEFIEPTLFTDSSGAPITTIKDNDAVIFFNFRIDRPRQLSRAFVLKDFESKSVEWGFDPYLVKYEKRHESLNVVVKPVFHRGEALKNLYFCTMTEYEKILSEGGVHIAFAPEVIGMPLGRIISENNLRQLRITESEKERFVTYYFNGQQNAFPNEEKDIIPSAKVPTYDQKPEMSAREITAELMTKLKLGAYSFVLVNFANSDMVGHTGNIGAAVTAIQTVDECVGVIANYILSYGGYMLITADHGNAEEMINQTTGAIDTEHSSFPVPFLVISNEFVNHSTVLEQGILADVAPTILSLMQLTVPSEMSGKNLLRTVLEEIRGAKRDYDY